MIFEKKAGTMFVVVGSDRFQVSAQHSLRLMRATLALEKWAKIPDVPRQFDSSQHDYHPHLNIFLHVSHQNVIVVNFFDRLFI